MSIETKKLFDEFEIMKSESDRKTAFQELIKNPSSLMLVTGDDLIFTFKFIRIEKTLLFMTPVEQIRPIDPNEIVFLIFAVATGQCAMKGPVSYTNQAEFAFTLDTELRKLQRRKNFRVSTLKLKTLKLNILGVGPLHDPVNLVVTDVSAGGISIVVPTSYRGTGKKGQNIDCKILHPVRSVADLKGTIRHVGPYDSENERWGIEFKLSNEQMQSMLALSLHAHRESLLITER